MTATELRPLAETMVGGFTLTSLFLAGLAAAATLFTVLVLLQRAEPVDEVSRRLERYSDLDIGGDTTSTKRKARSPRQIIDAVTDSLNSLLSRNERGGKLADDLARADLKLKPSEWVLGSLGAGAILGTLIWLRFGSPLLFPIGPVAAYFGSGVVLKFLQKRRTKAFEKQLGDTIILLSNALKAGYSFAQAIATVGKTSSPPMADEFTRATREMALGISVDDALNHMVKRNQSEDFDLMVTAVQIHRVVGGNLAEILDTIATTIRERVRIKGEISTLTAQARASGWIITLLPIGLAGILSVISPDYFNPMFHQMLGIIMLAVAGFSMLCGFAIIQKIVKIEV